MKRLFDPGLLFSFCALAVAISVFLIIGFIFYTALPAFQIAGFSFFTSSTWDYNTHQYGVFNLIVSTVLLTCIAIAFGSPLGILAAIYLSEYSTPRAKKILRPAIELLVGIPSVVYGIFGFYILHNFFRDSVKPVIYSLLGWIPLFNDAEMSTGSGYLLAATILAVMILPTIITLSQESLCGVPQEYREASYALGATKSHTIAKVVIPAGIAGIITAIVLAVMRAMGETMAVVMLIGGHTHFPQSLLDTGNTLTVKIVNDAGYWLSLPEPRSALFAIAATLFMIEILFVIAIRLFGRHFSENK